MVKEYGWLTDRQFVDAVAVAMITAVLAIATGAVLWRFKKVPEPLVVLVAALIGLFVHPLMAHA